MASANKAQHRYMLAIQVTFKDQQGEMGQGIVNVVMAGDEPALSVQALARGQQSAVAQLSEKIQYVPEVLQVVYLSINYIGRMTDDKFNERGIGKVQGHG
jgi:hypothetical protein